MEKLITDRKTSDIGVNSNGSYNITDMNRVIEWTSFLGEQKNNVFLENENIAEMDELTIETIPSWDLCQMYVKHIKDLMNEKTTKYNPEEIDESDYMRFLTIDKANKLELILEDIYKSLSTQNEIYCFPEDSLSVIYTQGE